MRIRRQKPSFTYSRGALLLPSLHLAEVLQGDKEILQEQANQEGQAKDKITAPMRAACVWAELAL